jgi:glyoxylase-like metal-dependent hydrolase (beta-lactamase superfamily II)
MRVAEGVYKIEGPRVGNAYLTVSTEELVLVDAGMGGDPRQLLALITSLGRQPSDMRHIVLTHWHPDHMGNAAELRRLTGAAIAIHELDAPVLAGQERPAKGRRTMGFLMRVLRVKPLTADVVLQLGDVIGSLEVIHVPGHTAGSIALRRDDGVVFSGDAVLGDRHGTIRPPDPRLSLDAEQATRSAAALLALEPTLVLPGHGAPIRTTSTELDGST